MYSVKSPVLKTNIDSKDGNKKIDIQEITIDILKNSDEKKEKKKILGTLKINSEMIQERPSILSK